MNTVSAAVLGLAILGAAAARAEVVESGPGGFTQRQSVTIAAPPAAVWAVLVKPALWWSSEHTFSGDASRLSLNPRAGGAWTEALPDGGSVRHLEVVFIDPPAVLRMEGALGPLQAWGVAGHLTFALKAVGATTKLVETYVAGGHAPDGLDKIAPAVDGVLGQQVERLKARVETGRTPPEAAKP
jgi:uncharacterized protein YndB with AHSA1/START domain